MTLSMGMGRRATTMKIERKKTRHPPDPPMTMNDCINLVIEQVSNMKNKIKKQSEALKIF